MNITKIINGDTATITLAGRLDTVTSSILSDELGELFEKQSTSLILDFTDLEYISSAGLRVLLTAQKKVKTLGTEMEIVGVNDTVKEVFDITGFSGILKIS